MTDSEQTERVSRLTLVASHLLTVYAVRENPAALLADSISWSRLITLSVDRALELEREVIQRTAGGSI